MNFFMYINTVIIINATLNLLSKCITARLAHQIQQLSIVVLYFHVITCLFMHKKATRLAQYPKRHYLTLQPFDLKNFLSRAFTT